MSAAPERVAPGLVLLHQDEALLVFDKPAGLHSVPPKPPKPQDSLLLRAQEAYPGTLLVHRLDRDTSGVIVFARTPLAQRHLGWQFERRQTAKSYLARVAGAVAGEGGRIDLPMRVDWPNRPRQMIDPVEGRPAVTDWEVAGREPGATRLRLSPQTGRSHQLRVHCLALGHPILGDTLYGDPASAPRLQLHAERIGFRHPIGGAWVEFVAPAPF